MQRMVQDKTSPNFHRNLIRRYILGCCLWLMAYRVTHITARGWRNGWAGGHVMVGKYFLAYRRPPCCWSWVAISAGRHYSALIIGFSAMIIYRSHWISHSCWFLYVVSVLISEMLRFPLWLKSINGIICNMSSYHNRILQNTQNMCICTSLYRAYRAHRILWQYRIAQNICDYTVPHRIYCDYTELHRIYCDHTEYVVTTQNILWQYRTWQYIVTIQNLTEADRICCVCTELLRMDQPVMTVTVCRAV